jgi:hypothetical protein
VSFAIAVIGGYGCSVADVRFFRDREWQQWPVTIVTGAYVGYALGKGLGGTVLRGKKVMFE